MNYKLMSGIFFVMLVFSLNLYAQNAKSKAGAKQVSAGVVNGKALSLPKPEYPAAAKAVKASGEVKIQVLIDETGSVVSATAVSGHPLLRQAAEIAARQAKFAPTKLSGVPVKVSGVIVYNFVSENINEEKVKIFGLAIALTMVKNAISDLEKFGKSVDSTDPAKELFVDFPEFAGELAPLEKLQALSADKRGAAINTAIDSVKNKIAASDKWQFELGLNFGEVFSQVFMAMDYEKEEVDLSKIDEASIKLNLEKIKDLLPSAPAEFPVDVLDKIKQIIDNNSGNDFSKPENLYNLLGKIVAMVETISPNTQK